MLHILQALLLFVLRLLFRNFFNQTSFFGEKPSRIPFMDLNEITKPSKSHEDKASKRWRRLVKYDDGLEYEYSAIIDRKSWKEYVHKNFNVKDSRVGLFYNSEEEVHEQRIVFKTIEKKDSEKSPDVMLEWDEASSSLSATLMSEIFVCNRSQYSCGKLREMERNKSTPLFSLEALYEQLGTEGIQDDTFDPNETMLRFGAKAGETATDVTLQSNAAGCLYETCVLF